MKEAVTIHINGHMPIVRPVEFVERSADDILDVERVPRRTSLRRLLYLSCQSAKMRSAVVRVLRTGVEGFGVVYFDMEPGCQEIEASWEYKKARGYSPAPLPQQGVEIEDRFWPVRARIKANRKSIPHLVGFCSFYGVSETFRTCVEALEPGKHDFRRVELVRCNGDSYDLPYYAMNVRQVLHEIVNWEMTTTHTKVIGGKPHVVGVLDGLDRWAAINANATRGKHLWISPEMLGKLTCSDQLFSLLSANRLLKGLSVSVLREI